MNRTLEFVTATVLLGLGFSCATLNRVPGTEIQEPEGAFVFTIRQNFLRVSPAQADYERTNLKESTPEVRAKVLTRIAVRLAKEECAKLGKKVKDDWKLVALSGGLIYEKPTMVELFYQCQ